MRPVNLTLPNRQEPYKHLRVKALATSTASTPGVTGWKPFTQDSQSVGGGGWADLIGDGTQLHRHVSRPGQLLGEGVVGQGVAVADTGGVQQQGVQDVLVHIGAFFIYVYSGGMKAQWGKGWCECTPGGKPQGAWPQNKTKLYLYAYLNLVFLLNSYYRPVMSAANRDVLFRGA